MISTFTKGIISILLVFISINIFAQQNILISQGGTVSVNNGDKFYDAGGPSGNDDNNNYTITLAPAIPGEHVCLDFSSFITYLTNSSGWFGDEVIIYDGNNTGASIIGNLSGNYTIAQSSTTTPYGVGVATINGRPAVYTPSIFCANNESGCLTVSFSNKSTTTCSGFDATIKTFVPVPDNKSELLVSVTPKEIDNGLSSIINVKGNFLLSNKYNNDFNTSNLGSGWSSISTVNFTNSLCLTQNSDKSIYVWMSGTAPRRIVSKSYDVSAGGTISFDFKQGSDASSATCESPDKANEGVFVEYSIDNGISWNLIKFLFVYDFSGLGYKGTGTQYSAWNNIILPIPSAAKTTNTMFRWNQESATSSTYDHWGIDNVSIKSYASTNASATITIKDLNTNNVVGTSTDSIYSLEVKPSATTNYEVTLSDGVNTITKEVTVVVNVPGCSTPNISRQPVNSAVCPKNNTCFSLKASGVSSYQWQMSTDNGNSYSNISDNANYSGTTTDSLIIKNAILGMNGYKYRCILKESQDACPLTSTSALITVYSLPTLNINDPAPVCVPSTINITSASVTSGSTLGTLFSYWNDSLATSTLTNPTAISSSNTYYIKSTDSHCSVIKPVVATINSKPVANAGSDQTICNGSSATLNASGGATYNWSNSMGTNASVVAKPTISTTYIVTVTGSNSCTATDNVVVFVNPKATTPVITRYLDTLKSSVSTNMQWYNKDGIINGETKYYYLPKTNGTYYALSTSALGCKSDTSNKYVFDTLVLTSAVRATNNYICKNATTKVFANASFGIAPYTYTWSNQTTHSGISQKSDTITVSPTVTTTYTVTITDSKAGTANTSTASVVVTVDNLSAVTLTNKNLCKGSSLYLNSTSVISGGVSAYTYNWSHGSTSSNPSVAPTTNTTYTVTVTDSKTCSVQNSVVVVVNDIPVVNAGKDTTICSSGKAQLNAIGATTYAWSPSTTLTSSSIANPLAGPTYSTTYVVTGTSNGCSATDNVAVLVNPKPSTPTVTQNADTLKLSNYSTNTIQWYNLSGSITNANGSYYIPQASGTYYAILNNTYGCKSDTSAKKIIDISVPVLAISTPTNTVCKGGSANIKADVAFGTPPYTYKWGIGKQVNNTFAKSDTINIHPTVSSTYFVTVTDSKSPSANTVTTSIVITVDNLAATTTNDKPVCKGTYPSLSGSALFTGGISSFTYKWNTNSTSETITPYVSSAVTYTVTITDSKGCTAVNSYNISAVDNPVVDAGPDVTICSGTSTNLSAQGTTTYSWSPATGLSSSTIMAPVASPTVTTTYTVTGSNGACSATDAVVVTVNPKPTTPVIAFSNDTLRTSGGINYQWYNLSGEISGETKSVYYPTKDDTYSVAARNQNNCLSSTSSVYRFYNDIRFRHADTASIRQILNQVSLDSLVRYTRELSGEDQAAVANSKVTLTPRSSSNCRNYILEAFTRFGLTPTSNSYSTSGTNIYAVQPGLVNPSKKIIISAHYDQDANYAADDDASGSAAVIEAARILSKYQFENTIVYALWDEEELGKLGSTAYANTAKTSNENILGVLQMEMFGYDSDNDSEFEIHVRDYTSSIMMKDLVKDFNSRFHLGLVPIEKNPGTTGSDHYSFWLKGYGAICTSQAFFSGDGNPYYHTDQDRINVFNLPYFHKLAKLNIGELTAMAKIYNISTGVNNVSFNDAISFNIFPNPADDKLIFYSNNPESEDIVSICNLQGQVLMSEKVTENQLVFDVSNLEAGVYFVRYNKNNRITTKKFIKLK